MKNALSFLFIALLAAVSFAQLPIKSAQDAADVITQPSSSIRGDSIAGKFVSNQYAPIHNGRAVKSCKGAVLQPTAAASGYLVVHLVNDPSGKWFKMYLPNDGLDVGKEFDIVADSTKGTTVHLDTNLYIYPRFYKQ